MDCKEFQKIYLLHLDAPAKELSGEMKQHLNKCPDCRSFARVLDALEQLQTPSEKLDREVLTGYRLLHPHRSRRSATRRIFLALAASLLILAVLTALYNRPSAPVCPPSVPVAAIASAPAPRQQDWDLQLMSAENEIENLELEMTFLLTSL